MTDRLNVVPEELRRAAGVHRDTAGQLASAPASHRDVMATLDSLGPIFASFREAGRELLDQRRACYEEQAAAHVELADRLDEAAAVWEREDADAARRLGAIGETDE